MQKSVFSFFHHELYESWPRGLLSPAFVCFG